MFNIQNYIAKFILGKVERYVSNIKADELQISLWQGELCFHNLDLNLENIEQELNIYPFTLISGKIEKLSVQVPWTRINYEPIIITINSVGKFELSHIVKFLIESFTPLIYHL